MHISDWSSDVCSSDLVRTAPCIDVADARRTVDREAERVEAIVELAIEGEIILGRPEGLAAVARREFARKTLGIAGVILLDIAADRVDIGEEVGARKDRKSTSELQSLMRISYAVFCLKKKNKQR